MRLPALPSAFVIAGLSLVPLDAQAVLPSRSFGVSPVLVAPPPAPAEAEWWRDGGPRIRFMDGRVAALMEAGLQRSAILRALVDRVEAGHVIVYVGMEPALGRGLSGSVVFAGDGGRFRYLRAKLNPEGTPEQIIAALAHELQHVVEVIDSPQVRSETSLMSLYRRIGRRSRTPTRLAWDTDAARQVTDNVRRELAASATTMLARRDGADRFER